MAYACFTSSPRPAGSGNLVVVGALTRPDEAELRARAKALDQRGVFKFSFERLLEERQR